jgi:hypothetical protein
VIVVASRCATHTRTQTAKHNYAGSLRASGHSDTVVKAQLNAVDAQCGITFDA